MGQNLKLYVYKLKTNKKTTLPSASILTTTLKPTQDCEEIGRR